MAALTITASAVKKGTGALFNANYTAGETITAGMPVYLNSSDGKLYKCDANLSQAASLPVGISLHAALADQVLAYQYAGTLAFGAILTAGKIYVVGASAAGDINPSDDLASGWYTNILGIAQSTSNLLLCVGVLGGSAPSGQVNGLVAI